MGNLLKTLFTFNPCFKERKKGKKKKKEFFTDIYTVALFFFLCYNSFHCFIIYVEGFFFFLYSFFYDKYIHLAVDLFAIGLDDYLRCFDLWRFTMSVL